MAGAWIRISFPRGLHSQDHSSGSHWYNVFRNDCNRTVAGPAFPATSLVIGHRTAGAKARGGQTGHLLRPSPDGSTGACPPSAIPVAGVVDGYSLSLFPMSTPHRNRR